MVVSIDLWPQCLRIDQKHDRPMLYCYSYLLNDKRIGQMVEDGVQRLEVLIFMGWGYLSLIGFSYFL